MDGARLLAADTPSIPKFAADSDREAIIGADHGPYPSARFASAGSPIIRSLCPLVLGSVVEHISGRSGAMI
jgi:hypothetical protein